MASPLSDVAALRSEHQRLEIKKSKLQLKDELLHLRRGR